ncbi:MAG: DUF1631 family protein [Burkholderiaceae bacterium]|nr:DUF1631 family protein [Burkholderiaceae bacterium]
MSGRLANTRLQFIDDELMRLPMVADQVFDATWRTLTDSVPTLAHHERGIVAELLQTGPAHRGRLVERFVDAVRRQVRAEVAGQAPVLAAAPPSAPSGGLSLLDETEIAADVETSHTIEAIRSVAEHELREMSAYASALAGDPDVSRDHNPFRAETYAQALWEAAQALPLARAYQARLMRHAAQPLAQVLRKAYAGACARLESQGIEPAAYRTLILPGGKRSARPSESWIGEGSPTLHMVRQTLPAPTSVPPEPATQHVPLERVIEDTDEALRALPADAPPTVRAQLLESQRARLVRHARSSVDQQVIEMLSRLFEAMLSDPRIARDIRAVLARLQPSALRLVLRDDSALDDYTHPVWRFMDMTAHLASLQAEGDPRREAVLQLAEQLIDTMAREQVPDAPLYRRGLDRLLAADRAQFEARLQRAAADVAELQQMEDRVVDGGGGAPTGAGPLDEGQLDTVPADLLDKLPDAADPQADPQEWLRQRRIGDWLRIFIQGQWQRAQVLHIGRHGEAYLLGRDQGDETIALRRAALLRLRGEGLVKRMRVRSMLRSAAVQVLRQQQPEA